MAAPTDTADMSKAQEETISDGKITENHTQQTEEVEEFPDPDEDDLDDLDDMLEDFSAVKVDSQKPAESTAASTAAVQSTPPSPPPVPQSSKASEPNEELSEEDFAKQLEAGMADLLGELEQSPDMQKQFEDIFKSFGTSVGDTGTEASPINAKSAASTAGDGASGGDASFQETIRRTMERMQASGEQATAAATSNSEEDFMSELLKQMGSGDFNAEGGEEEFSKMLMGMMDQLTNKEILYEPMKELHDKFPEWLEKNKDKTPADDLKRYEEQQTIVAQIVAKFEESSYSDSVAADREYVVERMQKMQAAGSPPSDLVGDMSAAQDMFNAPDDQCNPQ